MEPAVVPIGAGVIVVPKKERPSGRRLERCGGRLPAAASNPPDQLADRGVRLSCARIVLWAAVTETADEVSVTVYVRLAPSASLIRHNIVFVAVTLDEPLGERRLADGAG
jgi:hypothetical protein